MSRTARLLGLLELLREHRQPVTAQALAQRTGVSVRTLYRDIETLRAQGADIAGDAGLGYQLRPGFTLPPLMFSAEELEALNVGAHLASLQGDPALGEAAQTAMAKIRATLPAELRLALETTGLLVPRFDRLTVVEPWQGVLRQAIREQRKLQLSYRDARDVVTDRVVWPFAMAFFTQSRVLAAWCELRGDFRHFRADRVVALTLLDERCPMPRHVLLARWQAAVHCGGSGLGVAPLPDSAVPSDPAA